MLAHPLGGTNEEADAHRIDHDDVTKVDDDIEVPLTIDEVQQQGAKTMSGTGIEGPVHRHDDSAEHSGDRREPVEPRSL